MLEMKYFNLDWKAALGRFYLLMFLVILGVFTQVWAIAFLALPVFLSVMLGVSFTRKTNTKAVRKVLKIEEKPYRKRTAV